MSNTGNDLGEGGNWDDVVVGDQRPPSREDFDELVRRVSALEAEIRELRPPLEL